jgi:hypothetical protein
MRTRVSDQDRIAPLAGFALNRGDTTMIPLVQHFTEYSGPDVNTTAFRLIVLQAFPDHHMWLKFDNKVPVDWENDNEIPASIEVQLRKNYSPGFAFITFRNGLLFISSNKQSSLAKIVAFIKAADICRTRIFR